jgi:rSAM/selenodomain-associated transferase 2
MLEVSTPTVSIVIPVFGDTDRLRRLLDQIERLTCPPLEVICVDGGDDPACAALCAGRHCQRLTTRSGRGHQLHAGAMRATGDIIWFLHADAEPVSNSVEIIRAHILAGAVGGFFRFQFTGQPRWYKTVLAGLITLRSQLGVPYGDQGIFMQRTTYAATGGFADEPLFEEVPLIHAARDHGQFTAVAAAIGVSPRRWERDGWVTRSISNRMLATAYMIGISPRRLARHYHGQLREPAQ